MPRDLEQKIFDEIVATRTDIAVMDEKIDKLTAMVEKHDRVLYRSKGKAGLLDRVEDLEEESAERRKKLEDGKKLKKGFVYTLASAIILLVLNIILHYFGVL